MAPLKNDNFSKIHIFGPCQLSVHDGFVPNKMLDLGYRPLGVIKQVLISLNPNGP